MSEIILSVDTANTGATTNQTFIVANPSEGRTSYILEGTTLADNEELTLYGSRPKRSGDFRGVVRSAAKFTKGVSVPGVDDTNTVRTDIILNLSMSVPVGTDRADLTEMLQRLIALLDDNAIMTKLCETAITMPTL